MTALRIISTTIAGGARADVIGAALAAVAPLVDECLVIDTGLTDDSISIALDACAGKCTVIPWAWRDDFAAARNFALQSAVARGADWGLTADTDEVLTLGPLGDMGAALRAFLADCAADVVMVPSSCGQFGHPRLIRAASGARWAEPVHEVLTGVRSQVAAPAGWNFACVRRPGENLLAKYRYYARLLEARTRAAPRAPRAWYYLGDTYGLLGELDAPERAMGWRRQALQAWGQRARLRAPECPTAVIYEGAWACWRAAWLLHQHPALAGVAGARTPEDWLHRGLAHDPRHTETAWALGYFALGRGAVPLAADWARTALNWGPPQRMGGFGFPRGWDELPRQLLAYCQVNVSPGSADTERQRK